MRGRSFGTPFCRRPRTIRDHFAAKNTQRDFFAFFFATNLLAFIPFILFAVMPVNIICGPLRSSACAEGLLQGNFTMCTMEANSDKLYGRKNFGALVETFLPPVDAGSNPFAIEFGSGGGGGVAAAAACGNVCVLQKVAEKFVSTEVLVPAVIIGIIFLVISVQKHIIFIFVFIFFCNVQFLFFR